jgi:muramoyltetrapeptide carboxypeptidase
VNKSYIKAQQLRPGDKIGLVSPAAPIAALTAHRVELAKENIRKLGLVPVMGKHALNIIGMHSDTAEKRAQDIIGFFRDPEIKGIIALIGGYGFEALIPHLDFKVIAENPKVFVGHSGNSVLQLAMLREAGMVSFYGPHALTQFGEPFGPMNYMTEHFKKALLSVNQPMDIKASPEWTDEVLDWFDKTDTTRPRKTNPNSGYQWLRHGSAEGVLVGGCLSSLLRLKGTSFWPDFRNSLFFWEIAPSPGDMHKGYPIEAVDSQLASLDLTGVFNDCNGMIVGRPVRYSARDQALFEQSILENTNKYSFPILIGADIGHTDPIITLPIGVRGRIDSKANKFELLESGVRPF